VKLVILSRSRSLYSTRRLGLVGLARGHDVRVVDPLTCALLLRSGRSEVFVEGEPLGPVDAVISRIGSGANGHAFAILRQFEIGGAYCLNRSEPVARARDKLRTVQLLAAKGVGIVPTGLAHFAEDVRQLMDRLGGPPCVVKLVDGTQGAGVALVESAAAAASIVQALLAARRSALLQEFIPHEADARLFVVGRKVVAAMRRRARPGDFRANLHQGGIAEPLVPTEEQRDAALDAARVVGLEMAGVDLLEGPNGPLVVEVNASPGIEGIESASGRNVAGAVLRFLESQVREHEPVP
jgi:ribosomal protein S6--L-glutamate ligase